MFSVELCIKRLSANPHPHHARADIVLDTDIQELKGYDPKQYRHHRMGAELSDTLSKIAEGLIQVERIIKKQT